MAADQNSDLDSESADGETTSSVLTSNPTDPPALTSLSLTFHDIFVIRSLTASYPDRTLHSILGLHLLRIRGLQCVTFKGDLPNAYTEPLKAIMTSEPGSVPEDLHPMAVDRLGREVSIGFVGV